MPSHRLLESYFLWILAEKSTVIRPPGVDLEGVHQYSRSPTLTVLLVLPNISAIFSSRLAAKPSMCNLKLNLRNSAVNLLRLHFFGTPRTVQNEKV